ncbi:RNA polymerase sigma factor SigJ [Dyella caseinilytica]|uniref:RNA polymerase sigma factor SigJ n=1 Tax=Dyella caseinilytica TaxID=1849581 RepID=A0ABX7GY22_9GAMM|nr:RNA polymerase sigma factor SigJ [Dyella caseinilytica]QRN54928.1 RNA polymerase sigma factor SigJ [Dyella caseinilytica]GFZ98006.1 sigma factor [Dyella caseinilytica]
MDAHTELFQKHRPRLLGLAYRMLGTPADAEDILHDAWLRWHAQDKSSLDDPEAWLVTVTTRLALDRLRHAKVEREHYTGPWLPEPLIELEKRPEAHAEHAETLTMSFLVLLERLTAEERAAFLLHDVFDYSHAEAAAILDITEEASRQRAHRAKQRLRDERTRFTTNTQTQRRLLERFAQALEHPNEENLRMLFAEDAMHVSDGGGVVTAALRPLLGGDRITRLYLQVAKHEEEHVVRRQLQMLNGAPVMLTWVDDKLATATWIECDGEHIVALHSLRNPEKLARLATVTKSPSGPSLH